MNWKTVPASQHVTALTYWQDYIISHWTHGFVLSYRPRNTHKPLGVYPSLAKAKAAAVAHAKKNL